MDHQQNIVQEINNIVIEGGYIRSIRIQFTNNEGIDIKVEGDLREYSESVKRDKLSISTVYSRNRNFSVEKLPRIELIELRLPIDYDGSITVEGIGAVVSILSKEMRRMNRLSFEGVDFDVNIHNINASINVEGVNSRLHGNGVSGEISCEGVKNVVHLRDVINNLHVNLEGVSTKAYLENSKGEVNYRISLTGLQTKLFYNGKRNSSLGSLDFSIPALNRQSPTITVVGEGISPIVDIKEY